MAKPRRRGRQHRAVLAAKARISRTEGGVEHRAATISGRLKQGDALKVAQYLLEQLGIGVTFG